MGMSHQIDALNLGFGPPGLRFALRNVTRTVNADWFNNGGPGTPQQDAMKASLRQGGPSVLNIYSVNFSGTWSSLLGYSTFPQTYTSAPTDDGIVILFTTLPGGPLASYNQGKTGVHETGHWVGLYHTFQGSCFEPGDYVADTQPEATPSEGCMEGRATCVVGDVLEGEVDPIREFAFNF
ncbi:hypothetical protein D9611_007097 [Ephemerocybe angulata]|uniref:Peptidase M43 pregnancy-associated plasma-A domain-containing protein n=1 Tax=Ephemerocybe angulata TaxID=980116 RepID=A0A8H5B0M1_9AGAR|nr:hypothetical protein D9611_007097 [Tulosesus angulatus]